MIRFHWNHIHELNALDEPLPQHSTELELNGPFTSEGEIKERIAVAEGNRALAQYIVIHSMERA